MASFNSLEKPIAPFLLMKERYFPTDFAPAGYYMIYTEGQLDHCPDDPTKMHKNQSPIKNVDGLTSGYAVIDSAKSK